jgi:twitching motility protein PilT
VEVDRVEALLRLLVAREGGTDLHLKPGSPPRIRCKGVLEVVSDEGALDRAAVDAFVGQLLDGDGLRRLSAGEDVRCTHAVDGIGRFWVQAYRQRGSAALVIHRVRVSVASLDDLGLPASLRDLASGPRGLLLVSGLPRSGRTTTLAALVDHLNRTRAAHIVTVERPVASLHRDALASVSQLETGSDTATMATGARAARHADADILVLSDVDDAEAAAEALAAADDGLLVVAGMEAADAVDAVVRFVAWFPEAQRDEVLLTLAGVLVGATAQRLVPPANGVERIAAVEVLIASTRVRECLLERLPDDELAAGLRAVLDRGQPAGTESFEEVLADLLVAGRIDERGALAATREWPRLRAVLEQRGLIESA